MNKKKNNSTQNNVNKLKNLLDNHANQLDETPQQEEKIITTELKKKPKRFTVDIEEELLEKVREYGFRNKMKLRKIFELALEEYISKDDGQ